MRVSWVTRNKKPFWLPRNNKGFVDHKAIFQFIYCEVKLPYGALDELDVYEVLWLIEGNVKEKEDFFEMVSYSVKNAMISINKGKDMKMFDDKKAVDDSKEITKESRQKDLDFMKETFK